MPSQAVPSYASGTLIRRILNLRQFFSLERDPVTSDLWAQHTDPLAKGKGKGGPQGDGVLHPATQLEPQLNS